MKILGENTNSVKFKEADGNILTLPKNPQRTIVCLNSILDIWYMAGGTSLTRIKGEVNVPEEAQDLPLLGSISAINRELIMELEPDFLIVSSSDYQKSLRDFFAKEGIPGVSIDYATYDDFRVIFDLFTRLTGKRDIYQRTLLPIERNVQSIINQVPRKDPPPQICILFASTKYVKVETRNSITGDFCEKLGARNIYNESVIEKATRVDLSLEYILEKDPDIIFVTTMGDIEKCKNRINMDVSSSDIWGGLSAVKSHRFIYLDKSYSIYKPNRFYPKAFKIMADYLYPNASIKLSGNY